MSFPVTPPRTKHSSSSRSLYTPKTPFGKKLDDTKPRQQLKPTCSPAKETQQPVTPGYTPRHSKRKSHLEDAIGVNARSIFPPTPSTIGSGRKKTMGQIPMLSPIRSLPHVTDLSIAEEIDDEAIFEVPKLGTKRKLQFHNEKGAETVSTPGGQLISDELARKWNNDSDGFKSDEDDELFITSTKLKNPFMTAQKDADRVIKKHLPKQTEIVYVNKKGEKLIKSLTEDHLNYKPKNLFKDLQKEQLNTNLGFKQKSSFKVYSDEND